MPEGPPEPRLPVPEPLDEKDAGLEARVRLKMERGEPLTPEERALFAHLPLDKEIPAARVQEAARRAGGIAPQRARDVARHDEEA